MTIDTEDMINSILKSLSRIDHIRPSDIPNIDLYMDQVTTFMDKHLKHSKRHEEDKILTKTMINNYAKNDLLPPPVKKKYSKEHLLVLIFIYYFKGVLSITDIQTLLNPLTEQFFEKQQGFNMETLYEEVFSMEKDQVDSIGQDILAKYNRSRETFENAAEEDQETLKLFSFICLLSFDVYVKKQLIEKLIDELPGMPPSKEQKDK